MRNLMLRAAGVALLVSGAATSAYATDPVAKWCQGVIGKLDPHLGELVGDAQRVVRDQA